jgi:hypothetical protein
VDISDVQSFLAPVRRLDTSPGDANFDTRWNLVPGSGIFGAEINIADLSQLLFVAPPMFGGQRAYGGPSCQ